MSLATIETETQYYGVRDILETDQAAYLDLNSRNRPLYDFQSIRNRAMTYSNWNIGNPHNNVHHECVMIGENFSHYSSTECDVARPYVCSYELGEESRQATTDGCPEG